MSYAYGKKSAAKLETVHSKLREVAYLAIKMSPYDITIVHGWRGKEIQDALFAKGASKKSFPDSKHNVCESGTEVPMSEAIDFAPYVKGGISWNDTHIFAVVAGCFLAAAAELGVTLRWGGDWDSDGSTKDQSFMDWGHVEVIL